jgi:N-glycosidase YbiA
MDKETKILYTEKGPNGPYKKGEWKDFVIHTEKEIKGFFGEYRFLSNFWPAKVTLDGVIYPSVELAYQASKWKPEDRAFFLNCTEVQSIKYNRERTPNGFSVDEWDKHKFEIMKSLVEQKFDPTKNPENLQKLLETDNKHLEEMNWWNDLYWGTDKNGNGQNMLGKILMEVRSSRQS